MARGTVLVFGAETTIQEAVVLARARDADFAVFREGDDLFAFRPYELEEIEASEQTAKQALALAPWKKSKAVLSAHAGWPTLLADPTAPSSRRFIVVGDGGEPLRVEEPSARGTLLGGPLPARAPAAPERGATAVGTQPPPRRPPSPARQEVADIADVAEGTEILRYPSITASGERRAGTTLLLRIDLAVTVDAATASDPIAFGDLPDAWHKLPISVVVTSPQLEFADGANEGTIMVRRDMPSVACIIPATVMPEGEQRVDLTAVFARDDRWCGTAQRTFMGDDAARTTGAVSMVSDAVAPDLTIHIHRDTMVPGRLHWLLAPAIAHRRLLDGDLRGETRLQGEPAAFVRALFKVAAGAQPGEHVRLLRGIGEVLWDHAPASVQTSYWKLRDNLGDSFSIQLLTDEPSIPWELMRPVRAGTKGTRLLAETHPIARGLLAYPDRLRPTLPAVGERLTLAPDYTRRQPPLQALDEARHESAVLRERFHALALAGTARSLMQVLEDPHAAPVQLLHFAGHGACDAQALLSSIALEDRDLRVAQIRSHDVVLGEKHNTFVILNACEVGATGDVLGDVGGWAEAFAYRDFGGFLAPLWAVFDGHARLATERFLAAVFEDRRRIGEALRDVRRQYGDVSATFLSYIYYGDVNARFG